MKEIINYCIKKPLFIFVEILHSVLFFLPLLIVFGIIKNITVIKIIFLLNTFTPLHWVYFNNDCVLTKLSNYLNDQDLNKTNINITYIEMNFSFILTPMSNYFKKESNELINMFVTILTSFNAVLIVSFLLYKGKCIVPK
jgi:hypothetical protein